MRAFTVEAKSLESAQALYNALLAFHPDLWGSEETGYRVTVELAGGDQHVVAVLDSVQEFVTARNAGPAQVDFKGHLYTMHPGG
jgi:hypothetical protein